jgi:hypothetical protein
MSRIKTLLKNFFLSFILFSLIGGCTSPGPKFVDLAYVKHFSPTQTGKVGISQFKDNRKNTEKSYVGQRILNNKYQETYRVRGQNLSTALTELTRVYLEKTGFAVIPIPPWPLSLDGMAQAPEGFVHILSADINTFECRAQKKGVYTKMVLEIDLTFYLGDTPSKKLSTIPVSLALERTEMTFTEDKLEQFINQAFEEIVEKAFPFK